MSFRKQTGMSTALVRSILRSNLLFLAIVLAAIVGLIYLFRK